MWVYSGRCFLKSNWKEKGICHSLRECLVSAHLWLECNFLLSTGLISELSGTKNCVLVLLVSSVKYKVIGRNCFNRMWIWEEADVEKSPSGVSMNMLPLHSISMWTTSGCSSRNGEYILVWQSIIFCWWTLWNDHLLMCLGKAWEKLTLPPSPLLLQGRGGQISMPFEWPQGSFPISFSLQYTHP